MVWLLKKPLGSLLDSPMEVTVTDQVAKNGFTAGQLEAEMYDQLGRGFHWMPELVSALKEYTHHRDIYPTLNDFYPEIAKTLGIYVENEHKRIDEALGR